MMVVHVLKDSEVPIYRKCDACGGYLSSSDKVVSVQGQGGSLPKNYHKCCFRHLKSGRS